ncbi:MAG: hypothetical protein ACP5O4_08100, partial [bacterium]
LIIGILIIFSFFILVPVIWWLITSYLASYFFINKEGKQILTEAYNSINLGAFVSLVIVAIILVLVSIFLVFGLNIFGLNINWITALSASLYFMIIPLVLFIISLFIK